MSAAGYSERWSTPEGQRLAAFAIRRLKRGRPLTRLGLDTVDDLVDLRGLPVRPGQVRERMTVRGVGVELRERVVFSGGAWEGLDLTGSSFAHCQLSRIRISGCRFDAADLRAAKLSSCRVEDASFRKARLQGVLFGFRTPVERLSFRRVDFTRADMRGAIHGRASFQDCLFDSANLKKVDFASSRFTRCTFKGLLNDVIFWSEAPQRRVRHPNQLLDCDFSDAVLRYVDFRRLGLESVALPSDERHVVVDHYACVLNGLWTGFADSQVEGERLVGRLCGEMVRFAADPGRGVFNLDDLTWNGDFPDNEKFADIIRDLDQRCRTFAAD